MVSFPEFSSIPFSLVWTLGLSFHVGMYLKSYFKYWCWLFANSFPDKTFFIYTGEEDATAGKAFEVLQEKNMKIGKGVCDNIRSKEIKKKPQNSNAVEDKAFLF